MIPLNHAEISGRDARYLHWSNGSYAVVYRCTLSDGRPVALRCFLSEPHPSTADRYRCLGDWLEKRSKESSFLVSAKWVEKAVIVDRECYPVLLMDWVDGPELLEHVRNLASDGDKKALRELAKRWEQLMADMTSLGIVHGDIQHGNVLVGRKDRLILVDYDTLFLPGMPRGVCHVAGCPGYTHPGYLRTKQREFNDKMDVFPGLVILLSLRAIACQPSLVGQFTQQNLLLSELDLEHPRRSKAFEHLVKMENPGVSRLAQAILEECERNDSGMLSFEQFKAPPRRRGPSGHFPLRKPKTYKPGMAEVPSSLPLVRERGYSRSDALGK